MHDPPGRQPWSGHFGRVVAAAWCCWLRQDDLTVADPQRHPEEGGYVPSARGRCHDVPDRRQHLGLLPPVVINRAATITIKVTTSGKPVLIDGLGIARA